MEVRSTGCCGILELTDISTVIKPEDVLTMAAKRLSDMGKLYSKKAPYIIFSSVVDRYVDDHTSDRTDDYGQALADYITANGFGEIHDDIPIKKNWTGNPLKMWIWFPNYNKLMDIVPKSTPSHSYIISTAY